MRLVLFLGVLIHFSVADEYRLIFSHVIYRHGDRSPSGTYPNDKYQESAWPAGWGQLTPKGIREQYDLGVYLRNRYSNFLSRNFSRDELYVRSSDRDRALESAQSNLAGLYQPLVQSDCNQWLDWSPIPIHAVAQEDDHLLQTDANENCPAYQKAFKEQSTHVIDEMNSRYGDLFTFLKNVTGVTKIDFEISGNVYGAISREKEQGWEVPDWVDRVWNESTGETIYDILTTLRKTGRFLEYNSPEKTKLMSGFLTGDIVYRMRDKASKKLKKPTKMVMYSAHDGTVLGLLFSLNVFNDIMVPYTACVIIELHESVSNPEKHFVTIHYRNDSKTDPYPMVTPACQSAISDKIYCPMDIFQQSLQSVILHPVSKRYEACGVDSCGMARTSGTIKTESPVSWAVVIFLAAILWNGL